jgi:hypothetical protein
MIPSRNTTYFLSVLFALAGSLLLACSEDSPDNTSSDAAVDAAIAADLAMVVDAAPMQDVAVSMDGASPTDAAAVDATVDAAVDAAPDAAPDPCASECDVDDDCEAPQVCSLEWVEECGNSRQECVDPCEAFGMERTPRELRCCGEDAAVVPICADGVWGCPEGARQYETRVYGCGPGTNTPEPGVHCGSGNQEAICEPGAWCCPSIVTACSDNPERNCYRENHCDGPEDCNAGEVCCAHLVGVFHGSECRAADACAGADELITCNTDDDCPDAQACCAGIISLTTAICRAECLTGP